MATTEHVSKPDVHVDKSVPRLRLFAVSDTHGIDLSKKVEEVRKAGVAAVIHAGDFSPSGQTDYAPPNLIGPFKSVAPHVFVLHGNHDSQATADFLAQRYAVKNLHGYATMIGDVGIFGAGGAEIGPLPTSDAEILEALEAAHERIKHARKKVMVTHAHPSGAKMDISVIPGSEAVMQAILKFKPDVAICGHVHEAEGMEELIGKTRVVNVAKSGKVIDV